MNRYIGHLFVLLVTLEFACISFAPRRIVHDNFNENFQSVDSRIIFIEIDKDYVINNQFDEIYLFATWCPACVSHLKSLSKSEEKKEKIMYLSSNYDTKNIIRFAEGKIDTIFILSNNYYGSIESEKILKFTSELLNEENELTGLPQRFRREKEVFFERIPVR